MSTFGGILSIARGAISAHQTAIQVVSHNVANAETPGYTRQRAMLQENWPARLPQGILGTGVFVSDVTQIRDTLLDISYRRDTSNASNFGLRRDLLGQVEQIFHEPSESGLGATMDAFWNAWSDLSNAPDNNVARQVVQQRGAQVADALRGHVAQLDQVKADTIARLDRSVAQMNQFAGQVADLNRQIVVSESGGQTAGDLRDARNRIIDSMSRLASIQVIEQPSGGVAIIVANQTLVDGDSANALTYGDMGDPLTTQVSFRGSEEPIRGIGGELQAATDMLNQDLTQTRARLDDLARGIISAVNTIHEGGWSPTEAVTDPPPSDWEGSGIAFFTGTDAASIALSSEVAGDPRAIAAGDVYGGVASNSIALKLSQLRDTPVTVGGTTSSLAGHYRDTVTTLAMRTADAASSTAAHETLAAQSEIRRQSVSGVSTDEELVQLMRSQQAYVAATRLISAVDEMAQALLNMV